MDINGEYQISDDSLKGLIFAYRRMRVASIKIFTTNSKIMKAQLVKDVAGLGKAIPSFINFNNSFGMADFFPRSFSGIREGERIISFQSDLLLILWVEEGNCRLEINDDPYTLSASDFILMMPDSHIRFDVMSDDLKVRLLACREDLPEEWDINLLPVYGYAFTGKRTNYHLTCPQINHLNQSFDILKIRIGQRSHTFYKEIVRSALTAFLMDISYILELNKETGHNLNILNRQEEIAYKFLRLINVHSKEVRDLSFYADKLFITPQYLSLVLKNTLGKTASDLIKRRVVVEAQKLLRTQGYTVQQVSDILQFADQSSFGKFFRRNRGISPSQYRKILA